MEISFIFRNFKETQNNSKISAGDVSIFLENFAYFSAILLVSASIRLCPLKGNFQKLK